MNEMILTIEEQRYAADHHNLVYAFLNSRALPENDFYDEVIFAYLAAVKEYLVDPMLRQKYEFSTIAFTKMQDAMSAYRKKEKRRNQHGYTISLDVMVNDTLPLHEFLPAYNSAFVDLEIDLLMLEIASRVSKREMDILRMKANGYGIWDISCRQSIPMKTVKQLLASIQNVILEVCCP